MSHQNCTWCKTIEGTAYYYQSDFNVSKILRQFSDYDDILNRKIQTMKVASNDRLVILAKMRAIVQSCQP